MRQPSTDVIVRNVDPNVLGARECNPAADTDKPHTVGGGGTAHICAGTESSGA